MPWVRGNSNSGGLKGRERFPAALQAARDGETVPFPRASACGLSPGLGSPGPLGRFCEGLLKWQNLDIMESPAGFAKVALEKRKAVLDQIKRRFSHIPASVSLAEELIAERRAEAREASRLTGDCPDGCRSKIR